MFSSIDTKAMMCTSMAANGFFSSFQYGSGQRFVVVLVFGYDVSVCGKR